jgi:transcriptional regulator with XRE-family HTH domain
MVYELLSPTEIVAHIGKNLRLTRIAQNIRQEDLVKISGASLQAIKNLEGGGNVELITFIRVSKALGLDLGIWEACQPKPQTLAEIERIEIARTQSSRIRSSK